MPQDQPSSSPGDDDLIRLHITPLDPELLKVIVPASTLPRARNISFHTIETFPENRYGYVELPRADADKVKAKLNGAVLRGTKIRIDKARPAKTFEPAPADSMGDKSKKSKRSSDDPSSASKKRKRGDADDKVVDGVALTDRKVKRGWTETPTEAAKRKKKERSDKSSSKKEKKKKEDEEGEGEDEEESERKAKKKKNKEDKKRTKSKYTEGEECLLKMKIPANAVKNLPAEADDGTHKKKRKGKHAGARDEIIHEFEKTTKFPSFLKDSADPSAHPAASEYVEGKGWVDEEGNVVQAVTIKKKPAATPSKKSKKKEAPPPPPPEDSSDDDTSSSGTSSSGSSDSDSDSDSDDDKQPAATPSKKQQSPSQLKLNIPPNTPSDKDNKKDEQEVHPLEALYKRNKPADGTATPAPAAQPFSFFGGGDDDDDDEKAEADEGNDVPMPMTPFTRQDFESRTVRSAAPTPDTAHPERMANLPWLQDEEEMEEEEEEYYEDVREEQEGEGEGKSADGPGSDFQAWFWQNRRDLTQSWMRRKKTAAKEKRHRENKARASKVV